VPAVGLTTRWTTTRAPAHRPAVVDAHRRSDAPRRCGCAASAIAARVHRARFVTIRTADQRDAPLESNDLFLPDQTPLQLRSVRASSSRRTTGARACLRSENRRRAAGRRTTVRAPSTPRRHARTFTDEAASVSMWLERGLRPVAAHEHAARAQPFDVGYPDSEPDPLGVRRQHASVSR